MSKKNQKRSETQASDPVVIGPGIVAQQFGRLVVIQSRRTPEQQAALVESVQEARSAFPEKLKLVVAETEKLLSRHNSFELLANLSFCTLGINPESHRESENRDADAVVEYATLLCLKNSLQGGTEPFVGHAFEEINERLSAIISQVVTYNGLSDIGTTNVGNLLRELSHKTNVNEIYVRNPGYPHHCAEMLQPLFEHFDKWFLDNLGFTISDTLQINESVFDLLNRKIQLAMDEAHGMEKKMIVQLREYRATGKSQEPGHEELFPKWNSFSMKKCREIIRSIQAVTYFRKLGIVLSFTPAELAGESKLPLRRVESCLAFFSQTFGSIPANFIWPSPTHELKLRPFVTDSHRYLCPNPKLFIWSIQQMFERALNPTSRACAGASQGIWEKYADRRGRFLEREVARLFSSVFKTGICHQQLGFSFTVNGRKEEGKLDMLLLFDGFLFLIEAKAGSFPLKARRGYEQAIEENLRKLVAEAHEQTLRAKRFIETTSSPSFELPDGNKFTLDTNNIRKTFLVTVTLESLDFFCANIHSFAGMGLFESGELPWALPLLDLKIICETTEFPSQLIHYLTRRLEIHKIQGLEAHDELDWFGHYLVEGLFFEDLPKHTDGRPTDFHLGNYTEAFDDYYFYKRGVRKTPAEIPRQKMPEFFRRAVLEVDRSTRPGKVQAVCMLLDIGEKERKQVSDFLSSSLKDCAHGERTHDLTLGFTSGDFGITWFVTAPNRVQKVSFALSQHIEVKKYQARLTRWLGVLSVAGQASAVASWFILDSPWKEDAVMAEKATQLEKKLPGYIDRLP